MGVRYLRTSFPRRFALSLVVLSACSALFAVAQARGAALARSHTHSARSAAVGSGPIASAALEQCVTAVPQPERSATFSGEMTAIAGTARMAMRIDVQERTPEEVSFHTITAPGLSVWRSSDQKVKVYKYLKQVTNLSSPASYRAVVRFRWVNGRGRVIKHTERLTSRCLQPASPPVPAPPAPEGPASSSASSPSSSPAAG